MKDCMLQEPEYVFVVGTAHFSEASADDVERVIEVCHVPHCMTSIAVIMNVSTVA